MRLAHLAIAVRNLEEAAHLYEEVLDGRAGPPEEVPGEGVRVRFIPCGDARVELIESLDPSGPVARFLASRGEGVHHVAFFVDDLDAVLDRARSHGLEVVGGARGGAEGSRVAFLHPRTTHGTLIELIERRPQDRSPQPPRSEEQRVRRAGY